MRNTTRVNSEQQFWSVDAYYRNQGCCLLLLLLPAARSVKIICQAKWRDKNENVQETKEMFHHFQAITCDSSGVIHSVYSIYIHICVRETAKISM